MKKLKQQKRPTYQKQQQKNKQKRTDRKIQHKAKKVWNKKTKILKRNQEQTHAKQSRREDNQNPKKKLSQSQAQSKLDDKNSNQKLNLIIPKESTNRIFQEKEMSHQTSNSTDISLSQKKIKLTQNTIKELAINQESVGSDNIQQANGEGYSFVNSGGGSSSITFLQPHPLNMLIQEFQDKQSSGNHKKQDNIELFLKRFQEQVSQISHKENLRQPHFTQLLQQYDRNECSNSPNQIQYIQNNDSVEQEINQQDQSNIEVDEGDAYDNFQFEPNLLQCFYPKQVQNLINKKKSQNFDKVIQGLKFPEFDQSYNKNLLRMRSLTQCQLNFMQFILQEIQQQYKPLKEQYIKLTKNLYNQKFNILDENFDIEQYISNQIQIQQQQDKVQQQQEQEQEQKQEQETEQEKEPEQSNLKISLQISKEETPAKSKQKKQQIDNNLELSKQKFANKLLLKKSHSVATKNFKKKQQEIQLEEETIMPLMQQQSEYNYEMNEFEYKNYQQHNFHTCINKQRDYDILQYQQNHYQTQFIQDNYIDYYQNYNQKPNFSKLLEFMDIPQSNDLLNQDIHYQNYNINMKEEDYEIDMNQNNFRIDKYQQDFDQLNINNHMKIDDFNEQSLENQNGNDQSCQLLKSVANFSNLNQNNDLAFSSFL